MGRKRKNASEITSFFSNLQQKTGSGISWKKQKKMRCVRAHSKAFLFWRLSIENDQSEVLSNKLTSLSSGMRQLGNSSSTAHTRRGGLVGDNQSLAMLKSRQERGSHWCLVILLASDSLDATGTKEQCEQGSSAALAFELVRLRWAVQTLGFLPCDSSTSGPFLWRWIAIIKHFVACEDWYSKVTGKMLLLGAAL